MKRAGGGLYACPESADEFDRLKHNVVYRVEAKQPRNVRHHRLYFALLAKVFNNQSQFATIDAMKTAVLVALGRCQVVVGIDGKVGYIPDSISFASMDQTEFDKLWGETVDLVVTRYLPGLNRKDLEKEIYDLIGD